MTPKKKIETLLFKCTQIGLSDIAMHCRIDGEQCDKPKELKPLQGFELINLVINYQSN